MGADGIQGNVDLVDWRRRVAAIYRVAESEGVEAFRRERDRLFSTHPQSPIPAEHLAAFQGVDYFPPDAAYRVSCRFEPVDGAEEIEIDTGGPDGVIRYRRLARAWFTLTGVDCALTVFELIGYGGGLFVPFRDATSGRETYGGGRYLADTIKNHLLMPPPGVGEAPSTLDFNYAYNPSCAYNHLWACPLAPQENWLPVAVNAGERAYIAP